MLVSVCIPKFHCFAEKVNTKLNVYVIILIEFVIFLAETKAFFNTSHPRQHADLSGQPPVPVLLLPGEPHIRACAE